jgi:hypothetical protein
MLHASIITDSPFLEAIYSRICRVMSLSGDVVLNTYGGTVILTGMTVLISRHSGAIVSDRSIVCVHGFFRTLVLGLSAFINFQLSLE